MKRGASDFVVACIGAQPIYLTPASLAFGREAATENATVLRSTFEEQLAVLQRGSLELEGFYADDEAWSTQHLDSAAALSILLDGNVVGRRALAAEGVLRQTWTRRASLGALHRVGGTWQISGSVDSRAVVLRPWEAQTASGTGTAVDEGASSANGGAAYLHVTAASGTTPTLAVKVQHSADNLTFTDLITFSTATGPMVQRLAIGGTVQRYVRVVWTIGGTSPSFTFLVVWARY